MFDPIVAMDKGDVVAVAVKPGDALQKDKEGAGGGVHKRRLLALRHAKCLARVLKVMPPSAAGFDTSRMTLAFFALSGLDVLGDASNMLKDPEERRRCRQWIRGLYVRDEASGRAGFHGGTFVKAKGEGFLRPGEHVGHIAMTYTALACLNILHAEEPEDTRAPDPLEGLDRSALVRGVASLQREDGSFDCSSEGGESDMRFLFCAAAACHMLGDWTGVDKERAVRYIRGSVSYEGGVGQGPGLEAHGGSTFCALAALELMGRLDDAFTDRARRKLVTKLSHQQYYHP